MRIILYYCCLLGVFLFIIKVHQGFFIKHSSGLCLQPKPKAHEKLKGKDYGPMRYQWGPVYLVLLQNTCLHPDATFRFLEKYSVLFNLGKNGTFLARYPPNKKVYLGRFHIYHTPQPAGITIFPYEPRFQLKQTPSGSLKLVDHNPPYCATSKVTPVSGSEVFQTTNCADVAEQKFTFGSVTCEGQKTTNVNCHPDQVMIIKNAVYGGQRHMKTCGYNENKDCTVSALCLVKSLCEGKQNCSFTVNQNLFKADPCPGKSKYLYFEYICADQPELGSHVELSSSVLPNEGYLEIIFKNKINSVCDKSLDNEGKEVVCRQLGYQGVNKQVSSSLVNDVNSEHFSGNIKCSGKETTLSDCCVTELTPQQDCSKFASISCFICSEPLLEDKVKFPDSIFTASASSVNHGPAKARFSSDSSWCGDYYNRDYLDIDLGKIHVINSVTIFGDAVNQYWVRLYALRYTSDNVNWKRANAGTNQVLTGNKNAGNDASTTKLNNIRARVLRFTPTSHKDQKCMRVEICGHKLLPDQLRGLTVKNITSSSVTISWIPPIIDKWEKPITYFRIKIQEKISGSVVQSIDDTSGKNEKKVIDLPPYAEYELSVAPGNIYGVGEKTRINFTTPKTEPPQKPTHVTSSTLSFLLEIPGGNYSHFQVIASKLSDGKPPSKSPDSYSENELRTYDEVKNLPKPQPYIAAVFTMSDNPKKQFVLGDGRNSRNPTARRKRASSDVYYNGPLEPKANYSIFQRVYKDKDEYYSSDWSPSFSTTVKMPPPTGNNDYIYIIIGVLVVICLVLVVIAVIIYRRRAQRSKPKTLHEKLEMPGTDTCVSSRILEDEDGPVHNGVKEDGENQYDSVDELDAAKGRVYANSNVDDNIIYGNDEIITAQKPPILITQFDNYVQDVKKKKKCGFKDEFQKLPDGLLFDYEVSKKLFNKPKNRFGNIVTYDSSRVILSGDEKTDYINASHIKGANAENYYIATQGPKPATLIDFWRMVFEYKCPTIVMLTTLTEMGKTKCEKYWPDDSGQYGNFKVTLTESKAFADHVFRTFSVEKDEGKHEVKQFHFTSWPDHGVPNYPTQLLSFRKHYKSEHATRTGPALIHCSAGVGRTGVFIAIDRIIDDIEHSGADTVDIFNVVRGMRSRRMNMVQTADQYIFIHETILDYIKCGQNEVDAVDLRNEINKLLVASTAEGVTGFEEKFKRLGKVSPIFSGEPSDAGLSPANKKKNRKADIYPSEVSRVYLHPLEDVENSDYINACYVDGFLGKKYFIATQTPLRKTVNDFWRMIFQHNSSTIVMLNQLKENTENYPMFWPTQRAKPQSFGSITLQLDSVKEMNHDIILRKFIISSSPDLSDGRAIRLIQYTSWPDNGVPNDNNDVLALLSEVETSQRAAGKGPVTVLCSDGAGRTGTYIAISHLVDRMKIVQVVDVFQCIKLIRSKRPQFVENANQFRCCYEIVEALLRSFNEYSNFK